MVVFLNLLIKPVWLLIEMKIQDQVGHADWGLYSGLFSFGFLFIAFSDMGVNQFLTKSLASDRRSVDRFFPPLLSFKLLIGVVYPFVLVVLGWFLGYDRHQLYFLFLLCIVHAGNQLMAYFRAGFQAMQMFAIDGVLSIFERVVLLLLVAGLFFAGMNITGFIYMRVVTALLCGAAFYFLYTYVFGRVVPRWDYAEIKTALKMSFPFAIMTILYSVHDKVDQVMLERIAGAKENGLYAGAYRWLDAFSMYLWTVLPIFFARFAHYLRDHQAQEKLLHFGQVIAAIPMTFVSIFVFFYGEKLLFLFGESTPDEISTMTACLHGLFVAVWFNGVFAIFSTLLTATGHEKFVNRLAVVSIAINIVLNSIFIPRYGAVASAWTTVVSYIFLDLAYVVYIQFRIPVRIPWFQMAKLMLAGGVTAGVFFLGENFSIGWLLTSVGGGLALAGFSFLTGLLSREKIRSFTI
ncbi:MAG: oligosaccharide flippase family protein [Bacteroidia bacterium]